MKTTPLRGPFGLLSTIAGLVAASTLMPEGCAISQAQSVHLRAFVPLFTPVVFLGLAQLLSKRRTLASIGLTLAAAVVWLAGTTFVYNGLHEPMIFVVAALRLSPELVCLVVGLPVIAWLARREAAPRLDATARAQRRATKWASTALFASALLAARFALHLARVLSQGDEHLALAAYVVHAILVGMSVGASLATGGARSFVVQPHPLPGVAMPPLEGPARDALFARLLVAAAIALTTLGFVGLRALPPCTAEVADTPLHLGC